MYNEVSPTPKVRVQDHIPEPQSVEETGLTLSFLADLALKLVYYKSDMTSAEIAEALGLPFHKVMEPALVFLKRENLIEITGSNGFGESGYRWIVTDKGSKRAVQVLERDRYIGPAPVPLERYNDMVLRQSLGKLQVGPQDVREALSHLVLSDDMLDKIGPAVNSGRALFLYGPPGNGKTAIAEAIIRMLKGAVYIPYAVIVDGQIIRIYDEVNHKPIIHRPPDTTPRAKLPYNATHRAEPTDGNGQLDGRWVQIRRPEIIVGGELMMQSLDLIFDPISKTYDAPFQMKANMGLFVIDDFGRQAMRPQDLLNRWIVPLEERVDFLTLQTGKKIEIPFDQLTVFATNLDPRDLVDDAFLRRMRHKLKIDYPDEGTFHRILQRECTARGLDLPPQAFTRLLREHYSTQSRNLCACHPRDLLDQIFDITGYLGTEPALTDPLIDAACEGYFADI